MNDEILDMEEYDEMNDRITFTFSPSSIYVVIALAAFAFGLGAGFFVWGGQKAFAQSAVSGAGQQANPAAGAQVGQQQQAQVPTNIPRYDVPVDDDPFIGDPDAPITIIEFSDFECPFCTRFHQDTFGRLMDTYGDQIRFIYRDFPLVSIHQEAFPAAEAANCAGEQDMYWEYHDKLFDGGPQALGEEAYYQYAEEIGLDVEAFGECVTTRRYQDEVQADYDYAVNLGVRSTPTFFVNGIAVVGAQPFEAFQQIIEAELAGEIP